MSIMFDPEIQVFLLDFIFNLNNNNAAMIFPASYNSSQPTLTVSLQAWPYSPECRERSRHIGVAARKWHS